MGRKKIFAILMATIGCLIFNFNLKLAGEPYFCHIASDEVVSQPNNLLTNALSSRMTRVKGCPADLFVYAGYGHMREYNVLVESSYKNNTYALVLGVDNVWTFANEKYFRLGTALGRVHGKTIPCDTPSGKENAFKDIYQMLDIDFNHDTYGVELFGAYESFNDKCLKTNIGVILGYNYGKDKTHVKDKHGMGEINIKFASHNILLGVEFIKNLYAYEGYQFGLWLKADYDHVILRMDEVNYDHVALRMDEDEELEKDEHKFDHKYRHHSLATVVGLNVEKEIFEHADRKLTLSLKTGWEFRIKYAIVTFDTEDPGESMYFKNAAVVSLKASQKLNDHWSIDGSCSARFNKDFSAHGFAGGIEYAF
jgi:hypothetical protein